MDTFNVKKGGFSRDVLLKQNEVATATKKGAATAVRDTYEESAKTGDKIMNAGVKNIQHASKDVKADVKNIQHASKDVKADVKNTQHASKDVYTDVKNIQHASKDVKADAKNVKSTTNNYSTNKYSYDVSGEHNEETTSYVEEDVYDRHLKEKATSFPHITDNSDLNKAQAERQKNFPNVQDNRNTHLSQEVVKDASNGNREVGLHHFDHNSTHQGGGIYKNNLSETNVNKAATIDTKDNRFSKDKIYENVKTTSEHNSDTDNNSGNQGNTNGYRKNASRDSHSNKMDDINQQSRKQNGYRSNGVSALGNEINSRRSNEKYTDEHNSTTSSIYYETNNSKQPKTSSDKGKEHRTMAHSFENAKHSVSDREGASRENQKYNSETSHESKSISRHAAEESDRLDGKHHSKQPPLKSNDKSNVKDTDMYQRNYFNKDTQVDSPAETSKSPKERQGKNNKEKDRTTVASQSGKGDKYAMNNAPSNSTLADKGNGGRAGTKMSEDNYVQSSNKHGKTLAKHGQVDDAHRRRKEYVKKHYNGAFDIFSDPDDDDDNEADKRKLMHGKGRSLLSHNSQEDNEVDDYDNDDDRYSDREMLDQSSVELKATIEELDRRYDSIENEGNEWKTRFETQTEMNQQLERQILLLQEKVEEAKRNLKEAGKSPRDNGAFDDLADASPQMVKSLEKERNSLFGQLRDLEWRLDQESKAYHKANDERKQYVLEINATKVNIGELKSRQRQTMMNAPEPPPRIKGRTNPEDSPRTYRDTGGNIPDSQRILDPRYGPIRKTAGVKALPSLD